MDEQLTLCADSDLTGRLADLLEQQLAVMEEMRAHLERQTEALVAMDAARVESLAGQIEQLAAQLRCIEEQRLGVQAKIAGLLGLEAPQVTLTQVAAGAPAARQERLGWLQQKLNRCVQGVQEVSRVNGELIRQAAAYIEATLKGLHAPVEGMSTYTPPNLRPGSENGRSRFFDGRV